MDLEQHRRALDAVLAGREVEVEGAPAARLGVGHVADHPHAVVAEVERPGEVAHRRGEVGGVGHPVELLDVVDPEALLQRVLEDLLGPAALADHVGQAQRAGAGERQPGLGADPAAAGTGEVHGRIDGGERQHLRRGLVEDEAGEEGPEAAASPACGTQAVGGQGGDDALATEETHVPESTDQY